jgi:DNA-binding transcriptional MerR regulator
VAQVFDRSARTLRRWIRLGHLVPVRVGGALFFDPDDIRRLIAGRLCAAMLAR